MKRTSQTIWLCAFMLIAACAVVDDRDEPESADPSADISGDVDEGPSAQDDAFLAALATGDITQIQAAAVAASAAACHGTTTCTGLPINPNFQLVDCGPTFCGSTFCGPRCPSSDPQCDRPIAIRQGREQFRVWRTNDGGTCVEYRPALGVNVGCGC